MNTDLNAIRVGVLRELAKTAEEGYTGIAAYECTERETEKAEFLIKVCNTTADRLEAEANAANDDCPFDFAHTNLWCGNPGCREG